MQDHTVLLAALLHDIGKFWQRTGESHDPAERMLSVADYGPTGAHAKWSAGFIRSHVPAPWRSAAGLALYHHKPQDRATKLVALADRLAAGERDEGRDEAAEQWPLLRPVFGRLYAWQPQETCYPLAALAMARNTLFPAPVQPSGAALRQAYQALWQAFVHEHGQICQDGPPFAVYLLRLQALLQRFTWCVPAAYYRQSYPDVSLYDHLRATAAVAQCLSADDWLEGQLDAALRAVAGHGGELSLPCALLLGGDISGVQRFIYAITAQGAAAGLRGRSFYLDLLTEAVARWLVRELTVTWLNVLYLGGARFYLLLPRAAEARLPALRERALAALADTHGVELGLALEWEELQLGDFLQQGAGFGGAWARLSARLAREKTALSARIAEQRFPTVFSPSDGGQALGEVRCAVCDQRAAAEDDEEAPPQAKRPFTLHGGVLRCSACIGQPPRYPRVLTVCDVCREPATEGEARGQVLKCARCLAFEALGRELARRAQAGFLCIAPQRPPQALPGWPEELARRFGVWYALADRPLSGAEALILNDTAFARHGATGFRFTAAVTPRDEHGDVREFGALAKDAQGVARLGIVRLDVDDLGRLFREGLGDRATVSRVSALSSALRLFFEGWLNVLAREVERDPALRAQPPPGDLLYSVYAGGDDVFLVGAWDRMPLVAQRIREDFAAFTVHHPRVHLSAGMTVVAPKYPLYRAAEDAAVALDDHAKRYVRPDGRAKDALAFLDHTLGWEDVPRVRAAVHDLWQLLHDGAAPRALLHVLAELGEVYAHEARRGRARPGAVVWGRWMWLQVYSFARLAERLPETARPKLAALEQRLRDAPASLIPHAGLAARWAELLLRRREEARADEE